MRLSDRVSVLPNVKSNTHHISLSDGKNTLGFVVSDSNGNPALNNLSMNPHQRTAVKVTSGVQKWGDFLPPWMPIAQDNWEGGRGQEDYEEDKSRFFDSYRAQTGFQEIFNAPMAYYATGLREANTNYPDSVSWIKMKDGVSNYIAVYFDPAATYDAGQIYILLRKRGNPSVPLTIELCQNNADVPGTVLKTHNFTKDDITDTISEFRKFVLSGVTLTAGQRYWIKIYSTAATEDDYWQVGIRKATGTTSQSADDIIWNDADYDLYYRITDAEQERRVKLFKYMYLMFAVYQFDSGSPKLYINGTIGVADDNTGQLDKVIDNSKTWAVDQWKGCKVRIIAGKGYEEVSVYRNIVSNTADTLTVDQPWTIPHDTTTQYIIYDTGAWQEIPASDHGLTNRVTDVCVVNDIIYFAQGDHVPVRRMRWVVQGADGGWVSDAENYNALYLATCRHAERGLELWRANNDDKNHNISVSRATVIDWLGQPVTLLNQTTAITAEFVSTGVDFNQGDDIALQYKLTLGNIGGTNHPNMVVKLQESDDNQVFTVAGTFPIVDAIGDYYLACQCTKRWRRLLIEVYGTNPSFNNIKVETVTDLRFFEPISFHDSYGKINRIIEYSEDAIKSLWVLREGMVFNIRTDRINNQLDYADPMSLPELATVMEEYNGKAAITSNVYLYFSLMGGNQRYYNQKLDNDGPDRDAGLPPERQGIVSAMLGYPGRYFAAVDAGKDGWSSILMNNSSGWHEIYRAPNKGERITDLAFQAIPTQNPDKLWFNCGDDILWLVMPSKTLKAIYDTSAEYTHESAVISAWHSAGMEDINKIWNSLKVISDNLNNDGVCLIEADYQTDQDSNWYPFPEAFTISPSEEIKLASDRGVTGKRMRYRLRIQTTDKMISPRIKAVVVEAIGRVEVRYSYGFPIRLIHDAKNLQQHDEELTPAEMVEIIREWAVSMAPLTMRCVREAFDDKIVYLEAPVIGVIRENEEGYIGNLTLMEY